MLYSVWIPLTLSGQLDHLAVDQNMKVEIGKDRWGLTAYQEGEFYSSIKQLLQSFHLCNLISPYEAIILKKNFFMLR